MALVVKDRVKETTVTTGTGTLTLGGAVTGFQAFSAVLSNADTTYYAIFESSTGAFEVGLGAFTSSGTTLSRDTILESSNAGAAINLTAGAADVFITQPAEKAVYLDAAGSVTSSAGQIDISDFNNDAGYSTTTGTVTSVAASAGTGVSISGSPITTTGTLTITNTAPDQTVVLTAGANVTVTGTYPSFTIASSDQFTGTVTSVGGTGTVNGISLSGTVTSSGNLTLGGTFSATVSQISDLTATAAEINILDGVTASAAELNFNDITTLGTSQASKVVTADANGDVVLSEELIAKSYNETVVALSGTTPAVDCETGNVFTLTTSGNTTFTFSNPPASATSYGFTLRLTAGGTHTITYPASVDFPGGSAPDAPASGETDVLVFFTTDGGTTFFGFRAGDAMA